jgi:hypothetical protein
MAGSDKALVAEQGEGQCGEIFVRFPKPMIAQKLQAALMQASKECHTVPKVARAEGSAGAEGSAPAPAARFVARGIARFALTPIDGRSSVPGSNHVRRKGL